MKSEIKSFVFVCVLSVMGIGLVGCSDSVDPDRKKVRDDFKVVHPPKNFLTQPGKVSRYAESGKTGVGCDKFIVLHQIEGEGFFLQAFSGKCSISDLCWMMTRVYNEFLSPVVQSGRPLTQFDLALIDLAFQAHSSYVHTATAQFMRGLWDDTETLKKYVQSCYLHCYGDSRYWHKETTDMINTLCLKWMESPMGKRAYGIGHCFHECDREWCSYLMTSISKEHVLDIRWPNLIRDDRGIWDRMFGDAPKGLVRFNFDDAYKMNADWKELQTVVYFETVTALQRMNKEISEALSRVNDVRGYDGLHALIEKWRPRIKKHVLAYGLSYSDFPLCVLGKCAYDQTHRVDGIFSTDRPVVKQIAAQYTRATSDGEMHGFAMSSSSGHVTSQYQGYLTKVLGKDDYQTFKNSIRWRKIDPLKLE